MASEVATTPSPVGRMASDAMTKPDSSAWGNPSMPHEEQYGSARLPVARASAKPSPSKPRAAQQLYTPGARKR